jgi:hypothetical protein
MFLKTNIPETTLSFAGLGVDFGDTTDRLHDQDRKIIQTIKMPGNRCGHVPTSPRLFNRPDHNKPRPHILEQAIEKLKDVYRRPKKFFKKLATFHSSDRQKRSERREAIASVSQVLLHYFDLVTFRVGFYTSSGVFVPLEVEYIAEKAGIHFGRAKRAIAEITKAGYADAVRQFTKKEDGTFQGSASIRKLTVQFFIDLGIDIQKLFFARDWKRKQQAKAADKKNKKKMRGMLQAATSLGGIVKSSFKKVRHHFPKKADKELITNALELHRANPERSPSDYLKELQRLKE